MTAMVSILLSVLLIILLGIFLIFINRTKTVRPYVLNSKFFTRSELKFYYLLKAALKNYDVLIFSKVRLADFVNVATQTRNYTYWNKIKSKHIDFLICAKDSTPLVCIELDGDSHNLLKTRLNDEFKNELFLQIGIPFIRYKVAQSYDFLQVREILHNKI